MVHTDSKKQQFDFKSSHDIEQLSLPQPPKTTTYSTNWAINNYETWKQVLSWSTCSWWSLWGGNEEDLNYWLCHYIVETRFTLTMVFS